MRPYDPAYTKTPTPFTNNGSGCWFNSLTQALLSLTSLNEKLVSCKVLFQNNPVARAYIALYENPSSATQVTLFAEFKAALPSGITMEGQRCAGDGLSLIISMFRSADINLLSGVKYKSTITCPCGNTLETEERMQQVMLSTPIVFNNEKDFCNWLRFHNEALSWRCPECGHEKTCRRMDSLVSIHSIFTVILGTYWFPPKIEFPSNTGGRLAYRLVAIINHSGPRPEMYNGFTSSGHYTATVLRNEKWYNTNDATISPGNPEPTKDSYMAFYHYVNN
jgi:ubiquitin C-terminal hydrolase